MLGRTAPSGQCTLVVVDTLSHFWYRYPIVLESCNQSPATAGLFAFQGVTVKERERCLICGTPDGLEDCHWPIARGSHPKSEVPFLPVVPMCYRCHSMQHTGDEEVIMHLIHRAPEYWRREGLWEMYRNRFELYLSRRAYHEAVR